MTDQPRHFPTPASAAHQSRGLGKAHLFFGVDREGEALCLSGPVDAVLNPFHARRIK
ncbi:hypothetical protein [Stakelama pacifica]|uniref:Uncharacterized protein n=2 Tax=Stakelama pacifica TaxID=517720 RepID=A0A4R6FLE8_9SPHN|nr:hypothetical protein [Stakelama pacifica]TDN81750.1 hypothetical protein EV664_107152 [Stakelama pacifica]